MGNTVEIICKDNKVLKYYKNELVNCELIM